MRNTPKVGDTLTATLVPSNATNVAGYAWLADNEPILGATTNTFAVTSAVVGKKLKVVVTDTDGKTFESVETAAVISDVPIPVTGVTLSTTSPLVGQTIDAVLAPLGATNVAGYQWYADGKAIAGATTSSYVVASTDKDMKIKVTVTDTEGNTFESPESAAVVECVLSTTFP